MFGSFRFLLAAAVLFSHLASNVLGLNVGVAAVVVFYILSGYVMTGLIQRHYSTGAKILPFYFDRLMRIYPQYLFVLVLTLLGLKLGLLAVPEAFKEWGGAVLWNNLAIVPLNYFMYLPSAEVALIPPAWSLGTELQFYLLFPFLLLLRSRSSMAWASLLCFALACFQVLPTNTHSFRLLSGVLFMFLMGSLVYDANQGNSRALASVGAIYCAALGVFVALIATGKMNGPAGSPSVFLGLLLGFPAFVMLSRQQRRAWDEALGDLSYGLFLSHFLVIWFLEQWSFFQISRAAYPSSVALAGAFLLKLVLVFVGSVALAYVGYHWVEKPVLAWRKTLRKERPTEPAAAHPQEASPVGLETQANG